MYLMDRMYHLMSTATHADVHFLVGEGDKKELLPAHKLILSSASDVFETMFRFDQENAKAGNVHNPVLITDVDIGAFKTMLSFIYTDDLSGLNGDNVIAVLYAAKKYNVPLLTEACVHFPVAKLSNVFLTFSQALFLEEKFFADRCLHFIDRYANTLLESQAFLEIDQCLLCEILDRDQLRVNAEIKIWNAALRWADKQCRQNGVQCSGEHRRAALGPALFKIRFSLISKQLFKKKIVPLRLLSPDEVVSVLLCHSYAQIWHNGVSLPQFNHLLNLFPAHQRVVGPNSCQMGDWRQPNTTSGKLILKIKQFAEFARRQSNGNDDDPQKNSAAAYVRGMPWRIVAFMTNAEADNAKKCLGFFLHCEGNAKVADWSCECSAALRIVQRSQTEGSHNFTRKFVCKLFNATSNIWGFNSFISLPVINRLGSALGAKRSREGTVKELMDPRNGLYNRNDTVTLEVSFSVANSVESGEEAMDADDDYANDDDEADNAGVPKAGHGSVS